MKHLNSLSPVFLVTLLLSLVVGCGPEFTGSGDGGEAGAGLAPVAGAAGSDDEPQAGSAGTGGAGGSTAGTGGTPPRGGAAGTGGASAGVGGSEPQAGSAGAGTGGSAGSPTEPSCTPDEATLDFAVGTTFTLDTYTWTNGERCASCPPGGCGACTVKTASTTYLTDTQRQVTVTVECDTYVMLGFCGEETLCSTMAIPEITRSFHATIDLEAIRSGYAAHILSSSGPTAQTPGDFVCDNFGVDARRNWFNAFVAAFEGSVLRCE